MNQEDKKTNTVYYVNVYGVGRAYGGGEEGGWWYDTYTFLDVVAVGLNKTAMQQEAANHSMKLIADRTAEKGEYHMGNGPHDGADPDGYGDDDYLIAGGQWGKDELRVFVEDHPGRDGPSQRPHYE
jgi:hypothetical protein